MASKLQIVTAIFNDKVNKATESQQNWTSFLRTAANNFKYSFPDQILIYAQKPEATACAEISFWNEKFHRWVNRGATGIALLNFTGNNPKLRYVFDVSDTNSRQNIDIPSWQVEERYEAEIIEALENAFGEVGRGSLASIIDDTAQNMVDDNILDYLYNLDEAKYGSFLEDFDEDNLRSVLRNTLVSSIGYMMMTRCGINADDFYDPEDFKDLYNFNTHETIIALGSATSEIAEMGLREIETTVKALQKEEKNKNRTVVKTVKKHPNSNRYLYSTLYTEIKKLHQLVEQQNLLCGNDIDTPEQLADFKQSRKDEIKELEEARSILRNELKVAVRNGDEKEIRELKEHIKNLSGRISILRRDVLICERIENQKPVIDERIDECKKMNIRKEINHNEQFRRSR